jgi:hypothetical protein
MTELKLKRGLFRTIFAGIFVLLIAVGFALFAMSVNSSHKSYWKIQLLFPIIGFLFLVGLGHFWMSIIELRKGFLLKIDSYGVEHLLIGKISWKKIKSSGTNTLEMKSVIKTTTIQQFSYLVTADALDHLSDFAIWCIRIISGLRRNDSGYEVIVNLVGTGYQLSEV